MALRNGLLVHGPTHWAAAVRTRAGRGRGRRPGASRGCRRADGVPGVRGVVRLGEAMAVIPLVKRALPEARLPFQDASVLGRRGRRVADRRARAPAPDAAWAASRSRRSSRSRRRCSRCAAASSPRTTGSSTSRSRPTSRATEDASDASKEHERCGSHLVAPMLASNLAGTLLLRRALEKPGPDGRRRGRARLHRGRRRGVRVVRAQRRDARSRSALRRPGFEIQRLVGTREPDERQLEVGRAGARRDPARRGVELRSTPALWPGAYGCG